MTSFEEMSSLPLTTQLWWERISTQGATAGEWELVACDCTWVHGGADGVYLQPRNCLWTTHFFFLCLSFLTCKIKAGMLLTLGTVIGVCLSLHYFELYGRDSSFFMIQVNDCLHPVFLGWPPSHHRPLGILLNRFFLCYFSYPLRNVLISKKTELDVWRSGELISLFFHLLWV